MGRLLSHTVGGFMRPILLSLLVTSFSFATLPSKAEPTVIKESQIDSSIDTTKLSQSLFERVNKLTELLSSNIESELRYVNAGPMGHKDMKSQRAEISNYCSSLVSTIKSLESTVNKQYLPVEMSGQCQDFEKQRKSADLDEKSIYNYGLYEFALENIKKSTLKLGASQFKSEVVKNISELAQSIKDSKSTTRSREQYLQLVQRIANTNEGYHVDGQ